MQVRFQTVDVFTDKPFGGNPLAVVLNAEGLSAAQMQQIAFEFNYAETTFVLPPQDPAHTAQVRIFTPRAEVPFAGHPNVGTAYVLARAGEVYGRPIKTPIVFEEAAGLVPMEILMEQNQVVGAQLSAPESFSTGSELPAAHVADACTLTPADLDLSEHAPTIASCGLPFVFARLQSAQALAQAVPVQDRFTAYVPMERAAGIFLYVLDPTGPLSVRARMFAPLHGVHEDPATGSAAAALVGLLASLHADAEQRLEVAITQGVEMGRPSRLLAEAEMQGGTVAATRVGGHCAPMMEGVFTLH